MKTLITSIILSAIASTALAGNSTITCENGLRHVDKFVKNQVYSNFYERARNLTGPHTFEMISSKIQTDDHKAWDDVRMGIPDTKTVSGTKYTYEWHYKNGELELLIMNQEDFLYDELGEPTDVIWKYKTFTYTNCTVETQ